MIVVKGVEVICTPDNRHVVSAPRSDDNDPFYRPQDGQLASPIFEREVIKGETFINARGERVVLGMDKRSQEVLGLPFSAFDALRREIEKERCARIDLSKYHRCEISKLKARCLWRTLADWWKWRKEGGE